MDKAIHFKENNFTKLKHGAKQTSINLNLVSKKKILFLETSIQYN